MGRMMKKVFLYFLIAISFTVITSAMEGPGSPGQPISSTYDLLNRVPGICPRIYNNIEQYDRAKWDRWLKEDPQWGTCKIASQQLRSSYGQLKVIVKDPIIQQNHFSYQKIKQWMKEFNQLTDVKGVRPSTTPLSIRERLSFANSRFQVGTEALKSCKPAQASEIEAIENQVDNIWIYFLTNPSAWKRPTISWTLGKPSPKKPIIKRKPKRRRVKRKLGPTSPGQKRIFDYFKKSDDDSDKENEQPTKKPHFQKQLFGE